MKEAGSVREIVAGPVDVPYPWFMMKRISVAGLAGLLLPLIAYCGGHEQDAPHWSYAGAEGPESWAQLDPSFATCGSGQRQSPIDVSNPQPEDLANIAFHYQSSALNILNNGHTVQVNYDPGSYMELDGVRYDVLQFHYHAPSEHAIDGRLFPAELHIVHRNTGGGLAVVGLLITEGAENPALAPFVDNLPEQEADARNAGITVNASDFLPSEQTTVRYNGSLTTPPCSEGVQWLLLARPVELSAGQLQKLRSLFGHNNRPLQPLNGRTLIEDDTP